MLVTILLLVAGLVLLVIGADKFVEGASSLAKKFNVSELAIGLTVVAFGTSAPELIVNIFAAINGNNGIAYGNIIGSNSFNLLLILGVAGCIYPLTAHPNIVWKDTPYSLIAVVLVFLVANDLMLWGTPSPDLISSTGTPIPCGGIMSRPEAGILLVFFTFFLYYVFKSTSADDAKEEEGEGIKELGGLITAVYVIGGLAGLVVGGKLVVDSAVEIAKTSGMSEEMIGLTIVSAGTSLPELATSCIAAYRGKSDIAIANVIGSNIFNIFFVLAASAMITPIPYALSFNFDIYVLVGATVAFWGFMFIGTRQVLDRWQAALFIVAYVVYTYFLIKRG